MEIDINKEFNEREELEMLNTPKGCMAMAAGIIATLIIMLLFAVIMIVKYS